jgi:hypothetical protein
MHEDDSATWADHLQHLCMVLDTLRQCHLFAKESEVHVWS